MRVYNRHLASQISSAENPGGEEGTLIALVERYLSLSLSQRDFFGRKTQRGVHAREIFTCWQRATTAQGWRIFDAHGAKAGSLGRACG